MQQNEILNIDGNEIALIRSRRKTIAIEVQQDGKAVLRAPNWMPKHQVVKFAKDHTQWLEKQRAKMEQRLRDLPPVKKLTDAEIDELADRALVIIPERVRYYAPLVGVDYGRITIRNQKTKWGSCSSKGNLNFNCLLMLTPMEVVDSVVVHELCHRKHMNHSKEFYEEIRRVYPEYDQWDRWLKTNGRQILRRMTD